MLRGLIVVLTGLLAFGASAAAQTRAPTPPPPPSRFEGWTAAIIQADWRDGRGQPIEAFDNARRDLTQAFQRAGFRREDMVEFSLQKTAPDAVFARCARSRRPTTPVAA